MDVDVQDLGVTPKGWRRIVGVNGGRFSGPMRAAIPISTRSGWPSSGDRSATELRMGVSYFEQPRCGPKMLQHASARSETGHHLLPCDDDFVDYLLEVGEAGAHCCHDILDCSASDPVGSARVPSNEILREQLIHHRQIAPTPHRIVLV